MHHELMCISFSFIKFNLPFACRVWLRRCRYSSALSAPVGLYSYYAKCIRLPFLCFFVLKADDGSLVYHQLIQRKFRWFIKLYFLSISLYKLNIFILSSRQPLLTTFDLQKTEKNQKDFGSDVTKIVNIFQ